MKWSANCQDSWASCVKSIAFVFESQIQNKDLPSYQHVNIR